MYRKHDFKSFGKFYKIEKLFLFSQPADPWEASQLNISILEKWKMFIVHYQDTTALEILLPWG